MQKEMKIAKSAADDATKSANAEVAGIRAWIVFNSVELVQTGSTYHILMLYENAGKTPAIYGFTAFQSNLGRLRFVTQTLMIALKLILAGGEAARPISLFLMLASPLR
jgi:hypothetical protein